MGIILTSCLLLVSKPKDQVVTVTEFPQDGVKVSKVTPTSEFELYQWPNKRYRFLFSNI